MQQKQKKKQTQVIQNWEKPQRKQVQEPNNNHENLDVFNPVSKNALPFLRDTMNVKDINQKQNNFYHDYFLGNYKEFQGQKQREIFKPKINQQMQLKRDNDCLNVTDINKQKKFTFQWKRQTNPMLPNYKHEFKQSDIKENFLQLNYKKKNEQIKSSKTHLNSFLNVKDINQFQIYSFKSKRVTNPNIPNYRFNYANSSLQECPFATNQNTNQSMLD